MAKSSSATRSYHHGDLRQALLAAALSVLQERGAAGLSLREVARRAGVSHAAPAHHFGDKAGLLTALATDGFTRFGEALAAAAARESEPRAAFAATGRAYVQFAVDHRALFELMFRPEHLNREAPELAAAMDRSYQQLLQGVINAQRAGYAPGASPQDLALAAWTSVHGLATLWLDGNLQAHTTAGLDELYTSLLAAGAAERKG